MDYKGASVFVELDAACDYTGFDCQGGGTIFVSYDANLFMKLILDIRSSLAKDGIRLDDIIEYDKIAKQFWTSAPMLKYLCHLSVYENRKLLTPHYREVLPKILKDSVDDFIRVKEAKDYYDNPSDSD